MIKGELQRLFKNDPKYSQHVRDDVPGSDVKAYGSRARTSSKGTFCKGTDYLSGGGLAALFTGAWMRVAKDGIDPIAWSHQFEFQRKSDRQNWRHHFLITEAGFDALALARTDLGLPLDEITLANPRTAEQVVYKVASGTKGPRATSTERNGNRSRFELPRGNLAGTGASAIRLLIAAEASGGVPGADGSCRRHAEGATPGAHRCEPIRAQCRGPTHGDRSHPAALDSRGI
jgi:hypothetical protein